MGPVRAVGLALAAAFAAACASGTGAPIVYRDEIPAASPSGAVGSGGVGPARSAPLRQPPDNPADRAVEVRRGDSLGSIARRYSVNTRALAIENGLSEPYTLQPGQIIYLPRPRVHVVEHGESFASVADRFGMDRRSLAVLNGLARPWTLFPGDEVLLPPLVVDRGRTSGQVRSGQADGAGAAPLPASPASARPIAGTGPAAVPPRATPAPGVPLLAVNPQGGARFVWPVEGRVLAGYGPREGGVRNDGINIAAEAEAPVRAAAGGRVVYAGDEVAGFGNLLLVEHEGGWVTAYAHASRLAAAMGDAVRQGDVIAYAGATGSVAEVQVHFELRRGREPVDPTAHLPALVARAGG